MDAIFQILDVNNDESLTIDELEKVLACIRPFQEGFENTQDENGALEAAKLMRKLEAEKNGGKISRETFVSTLLKDTELENFQRQFNINEASYKPGEYYTEPGKMSLGNFLKNH